MAFSLVGWWVPVSGWPAGRRVVLGGDRAELGDALGLVAERSGDVLAGGGAALEAGQDWLERGEFLAGSLDGVALRLLAAHLEVLALDAEDGPELTVLVDLVADPLEGSSVGGASGVVVDLLEVHLNGL